jgi:glutamate-ammonia-ligase adenylyltransferase
MPEIAVQPVFRDKERAAANLGQLARDIPPAAMARVHLLLGSAADPDAALHYLVRFREQQPAAFQRLAVSPAGMQYLVAVFSSSRFLSEGLLRRPEWIELLPGRGDLHRVITTQELVRALEAQLAPAGLGSPPPLQLAQFRRQQMLRILIRDLLGFGALGEITEELSNLADAILEVAYRRIRYDLSRRYGTPRCATAEGEQGECGFSIIALGKLGGRELNYSSDIDLMFVYSANGETGGRETISNREFFGKLANYLTDILSTHTAEGKCYRVDLRLRPEGRLGEVCVSVDGARTYYEHRARDWELQMLIKARVCAGERAPGQELLDTVEPLIYKSTLDFSAIESVSETRERISEKANLRKLRGGGANVKLARGGIRDIEFLVQCLQRLHGGRETWVRRAGTRVALRRLRDKELLSDSEYSRLASAYEFLRHLEHRLQFLDDRQTHELPAAREDLETLARRMPELRAGSVPSAERLLQELNAHLEEVQEIYERVIHSQQPVYYGPHPESLTQPGFTGPEPDSDFLTPAITNLVRFLDERAPSLAATLSRSRLRQGAKAFEHFLEHVLDRPHWLNWLDSDPVLAGYVTDLFEHSSHFAEQLVRRPELLGEFKRMRESPGRVPNYPEMVAMAADASALRRFFLREMLRIQAESICLRTPIFETLKRTSELADAAIGASYQMAVEDARRTQPPSDPQYEPRKQMVVIALGRLGMIEFDLASDADLVFVLPDSDSPEIPFWTRVAERMIQQITAYTGEGVLFAVDTRLRPNGREGMLVQTDQAFKDYFAQRAEAWEGITYMKSRAVAGDIEWGTKFLNELQEVDWRRWGQSGRSKRKLWDMRMRLEKEQGASNPLKAGRGGYYDIDFALMYLRLKAAGFFFKVLNTPERIDIIEKMGHLDRDDAAFLLDAATFYRAVDHGLRVFSGQAAGNLPKSRAPLEALQGLVSRWTPEHLHDQPLDVELAQIQARTREFFERLFG